jgi:hypothetical protein
MSDIGVVDVHQTGVGKFQPSAGYDIVLDGNIIDKLILTSGRGFYFMQLPPILPTMQNINFAEYTVIAECGFIDRTGSRDTSKLIRHRFRLEAFTTLSVFLR